MERMTNLVMNHAIESQTATVIIMWLPTLLNIHGIQRFGMWMIFLNQNLIVSTSDQHYRTLITCNNHNDEEKILVIMDYWFISACFA